MQRLYSIFPGNGPGVGLVLLRLAVIAPLFNEQSVLAAWTDSTVSLIACAVLGVMLGLGVATPIAALVAIAWQMADFGYGNSALSGAIAGVAGASALGLLGPGAWSLDAQIYGRRLLAVPPATDSP